MESKELLFNLIKKLESEEIRFFFDKGAFFLTDGEDKIKVLMIEKWFSSEKEGKPALTLDSIQNFSEWNKEFKENFKNYEEEQ